MKNSFNLFIAFLLAIILFSSCEKKKTNYDLGIQLEAKNFKVDSKNWPTFGANGITFKIYSPDHNDYVIIEFVSGVADYLIGQQLFSKSAAYFETGKVGKELPTSYELDQYLRELYGKKLNSSGGLTNINTKLITGLIRPGYVTIGGFRDSGWVLANFSLHDLYRGFGMWSGNGSLSIQILDRGIGRMNFSTDGQLYLLSVRCKKQ